jgi:hypothetical protein
MQDEKEEEREEKEEEEEFGGGRRRSSNYPDYPDTAFCAVHDPKNCHIHQTSSYSALFLGSAILKP